MEENEGSFKTKTSKILARTKVWPLGKSKFSAFGHLTEKVWNAIETANGTIGRGNVHKRADCQFRMNRYLLVVNPGLERVLLEEVRLLVPSLQEGANRISCIRGGIEMDCMRSCVYG